ncbi:hypothetical protein V9T40_000503 [Parthenolecanium corni]|uniref:Cytochrome P450 n=1 Tax=Parthenolecanium corni TaxID=536013 RepID=A0AAN9TBA1_9HEMI
MNITVHIVNLRNILFLERLEKFQEWFKSFGHLIRTWIGPVCAVHVANADHAQTILSSNVNIEKCFQYSFGRLWLGNCLTLAASENWFEKRNLLTHAFHATVLNDFFDTMLKNCQILMKSLEKEADLDEFDIFPHISDCTVNTVAETAMNIKPNAESRLDAEYPKNLHEFSDLLWKRILNPLVYLNFMYAVTEDYKKVMKVITELKRMSLKVIKQRMVERKIESAVSEKANNTSFGRQKYKAVLDLLLDRHDEGKYPLTLEEIREEVDDFMFAGSDPLTLTISMTIYLIGHHPEVQDKIHAELDSLFPFEDSSLNVQTLAKLKYLDCAIKETMRLYPPVPFIARSLKEPVILDNHIIPRGTTVAIHIHAIHRSPEFYSNPDKFDPSNFFPENEENRHPFAYIPFSGGPRNCIGFKFAKMEIKTALALFFKKYEVKSTTPIEDLSMFTEIFQKPENGIMVKIRRRH